MKTIKKENIFLTGITGGLGRELLKEILLSTEDCLYVLVRSSKRLSARERMEKILAAKGLLPFLDKRVFIMEGDVTLPCLGLSKQNQETLKKEVTQFFHIAAVTALNGSEEDCMKVNVGGTVEALALAEMFQQEGDLHRFFYFSTAFVAGSRQDYYAIEDELPAEPAHANYYESSKYLAETKVREAMKRGLRITILRPSIVVGDSKTGEVSDFNVIYPFIKLFVHGILTKLPTDLDNSFNIVPIDFVIKASLLISKQEDSLSKTYHLVTMNPPKIRTLLQLKEEVYPNTPDVEIIAIKDFCKEKLEGEEKLVFGMLEPYLGYLNDHLTFDATNTHEALKGTKIDSPVTDYAFLKIIINYAFQTGYLIHS